MKKNLPSKKNTTTKPGDDASYDERIAGSKRAATEASLGRFVGHIKNSRMAALESVRQGKTAINEMYEAGKEWVIASDKNQFGMFFYDAADTLVKPEDREFITANIVKTSLHLAGTMPAPVKTEAEAAQHIQKVLWALDIAEKPERISSGGQAAKNWGELIPVETGKFNQFLVSLFDHEPVAIWPPDREDTFLAQTEFIEKARLEVKAKKAGRLLSERGEA